MKMNGFVCDKCGKIDYILIDGYGFGERILEGVKFRVFKKNGKFSVESVENWKKDGYLKQLNEKHWMKEAKAFIQDLDIAECSKCGEDVGVQDE
jgi:hypothetical protein